MSGQGQIANCQAEQLAPRGAARSLQLNQAAEQLRRLIERYPDVKANCFDVKFPDARGRKGQKGTATSDATGIVRIRQPAAEHQEH